MEKTAVQWFYDQMENLKIKARITGMSKTDFVSKKEEFLEKANEMFEKQIIDACKKGYGSTAIFRDRLAKEYYNETFKQ
jgi:hypothetical protein